MKSIKVTNVSDALHVWRTEPEIWSLIKQDFPSQLADLTTFEHNANCSCWGRLVKFFQDLVINKPGILDQYNKKPELIDARIKDRVASSKQARIGGSMYSIEPGEEAWAEFVDTVLKGKHFMAFSTHESSDGKVKVYFL